MACFRSDRVTGIELRTIRGIPLAITEPTRQIQGITFLLSGTNLPLEYYISIRRTLLSVGQVVVDYSYKSFSLHSRNHIKVANSIKNIFPYLSSEYDDVDKYGIVGHGIGGKIALMVAAVIGRNNFQLEMVIALDPIDENPVQFTNRALSFEGCRFPIFVSHTGSVMKNGAIQIYNEHAASVKLLHHKGADHLAYCDINNSQSCMNNLPKRGNETRNTAVKKNTIRTIKKSFRWINEIQSCTPEQRRSSIAELTSSIVELNDINFEETSEDTSTDYRNFFLDNVDRLSRSVIQTSDVESNKIVKGNVKTKKDRKRDRVKVEAKKVWKLIKF